ncbi:hypothetical protein BKA93DRAFT_751927 [Sparassis latifolia]|uniref:Uncharacterized protein n=1 Tax=Sparassis crispa TaxID=139825 RepID=A0A401H6N2_9APHY|nr:hypothetical protein SCP_1800420 [Sparassis crispa]GBE90020.1 hypothetical protein SCP_1800420 [Sparassis crispa]
MESTQLTTCHKDSPVDTFQSDSACPSSLEDDSDKPAEDFLSRISVDIGLRDEDRTIWDLPYNHVHEYPWRLRIVYTPDGKTTFDSSRSILCLMVDYIENIDIDLIVVPIDPRKEPEFSAHYHAVILDKRPIFTPIHAPQGISMQRCSYGLPDEQDNTVMLMLDFVVAVPMNLISRSGGRVFRLCATIDLQTRLKAKSLCEKLEFTLENLQARELMPGLRVVRVG